MSKNYDHDSLAGPLLGLLGSAGAITVAVAFSTIRDEAGQVIVALALMAVVVAAAAIGGRAAGLYTATSAALSFNFWHTKPYLSLRIHSGRDVVTTALLFGVGLSVGELARLREQASAESKEARSMLTAIAKQSDLVAFGSPATDVWLYTQDALTRCLRLKECRYEPFGTEAPPLPRIEPKNLVGERHHLRFQGDGFALPSDGAELVVRHHDEVYGRIVMIPSGAHGVTATARRFAVTMAENLGAALVGNPLPS
ncbi:MAG: DUF4118 domain-containing protein [Acidimicrobiia bacterium]